jgi:hypothetical protein
VRGTYFIGDYIRQVPADYMGILATVNNVVIRAARDRTFPAVCARR